jgi:hypothetical protein
VYVRAREGDDVITCRRRCVWRVLTLVDTKSCHAIAGSCLVSRCVFDHNHTSHSYHGSSVATMGMTGDQRRWGAEAGATGNKHFFDPYPCEIAQRAHAHKITSCACVLRRLQVGRNRRGGGGQLAAVSARDGADGGWAHDRRHHRRNGHRYQWHTQSTEGTCMCCVGCAFIVHCVRVTWRACGSCATRTASL